MGELSEKQREDFLNYLKKSGYEDSWRYLILAKNNVGLRGYLIEIVLDQFEYNLKSPVDRDIQTHVRKTHALQLDIISKLFVLIEDFLWYNNILRTNPKSLSKKLIIRFGVNLDKELKYLENITKEQIYSDYKFPKLEDFSISKEDAQFLEKVLEAQATEIKKCLDEIIKFWRNYKRVYNTYKHGLSAITGLYQIIKDKDASKISSHIYVRNARDKKGDEVDTFIIPTDMVTANYYDNIRKFVISVFFFLIDCHLYHINNRERAFYPEIWDFITQKPDEIERLKSLINKLDFIKIDPSVLIKLEIEKEAADKVRAKIKDDYIYKSPKDIFKIS